MVSKAAAARPRPIDAEANADQVLIRAVRAHRQKATANQARTKMIGLC